MVATPVATVFGLLWGLAKTDGRIMLRVSNMCAIIVTFLSMDRDMPLDHG